MHRSPVRRTGITLIEMLIAIAISLIVMMAVISIFDQLNTSMNASKATIEQAGELRNLAQRLQADLDGMTALTLPWTPADAGDGYFEIIEGSGRDSNNIGSYWGDRDDRIMFTARSQGRPFVGRFNGAVIESELAEIVWWTDTLTDLDGSGTVGDNPREIAIFRRALLIRPDLTPTGANVATFLNSHDVSVRLDGGSLVANSLADLTLRENRVAHSSAYPHAVNIANLPRIPIGNADEGIDMVLDKVVAFDVRVYDPLAPLRTASGETTALVPGDTGWATAATAIGRGAYVDLGYTVTNWASPLPDYADNTTLGDQTLSYYSGRPSWRSKLDTQNFATYSTWPAAYEQDGIDQDSLHGADEGNDGFETPIDRVTNGTGYPPPDSSADVLPVAADDPSEYETFPPYPHPGIVLNGVQQKFAGLRGVQVRIRIVEPDSRQVRQATVIGDFLPE